MRDHSECHRGEVPFSSHRVRVTCVHCGLSWSHRSWSPEGEWTSSRFLHCTVTFPGPFCTWFLEVVVKCSWQSRLPPSLLMTQGIYGGNSLLVRIEDNFNNTISACFCIQHTVLNMASQFFFLVQQTYKIEVISFCKHGNWTQRLNNLTRSHRARAETQVCWVLQHSL